MQVLPLVWTWREKEAQKGEDHFLAQPQRQHHQRVAGATAIRHRTVAVIMNGIGIPAVGLRGALDFAVGTHEAPSLGHTMNEALGSAAR
mmetsp:Transcript_90772/g.230977  ORF Transcript_90772/g.230977 Transcript_90772/m.230977 type:complete len:89 (+) Transcript_90772:1009-1275(+)